MRASRLGADFDRFFVAAASSNLGDGIRLGALPLLATTLTDDARLIAGVTMATFLPWFLFGAVGGAIVDRSDRKRLMVWGQIGRALLVALLVGLIIAEQNTIWWTLVVAFGLGAGEVFVDSSSQAAIPQLVPDDQLDRANSRLVGAMTLLDAVVGVALGSILFDIATPLPFAIDAVTFVIGAALLLTVRRPLQAERDDTDTKLGADIVEGLRYLAGHRLLRGLAASVSISNMAGSVIFSVLVIKVTVDLGADERLFGIVLGVGAIGGVLGSLVASRVVARFGRKATMSLLPPVLLVSNVTMAFAPNVWVVATAVFFASVVVVIFNVPGQSMRQAITPQRILGRVVASSRMIGLLGVVLGALIGGVVTESYGIESAGVVAGVGDLISWVLLLLALRHYDETPATDTRLDLTGDPT